MSQGGWIKGARGAWLVGLAAMVGLALQVHSAYRNSSTYDEPTYLRVASRWWRTGNQDEITRMGSPLTFWKLQQAPVFWLLDRTGRASLVDDPTAHEPQLLPLVRIGSLWIWLVALGVTAWWSRRLYGHRAMIFAAWLFALSPNLLAHGMLVTMEMPLVACTVGLFAFFWKFLESGQRRWFWRAAIVCGLASSCKYTVVVYFPILALVWWFDRWRPGSGTRPALRSAMRVALGMVGFVLIAGLVNLVVTGFAMIPLSTTHEEHPSLIRWFGEYWGRKLARLYEMPLPQDLVGFATQLHHQATGGASYLLGERRMKGWWYYYFVALAVKVPITFFALAIARVLLASRIQASNEGADQKEEIEPDEKVRSGNRHDAMLPLAIACFLVITALGSSRNYGIRYLLPLAPLAIVWVSGLAEVTFWNRLLVPAGLIGAAFATATIHPYELTYFNVAAGGPLGGRHILADSNLDWGQGLIDLARLQRERPEYQDLTLYYFGDTEPARYGVAGTHRVIRAVGDYRDLPAPESVKTRYVGVSASLQWGPWGIPGFFDRLDAVAPARMTDDTTIAIYEVSKIPLAGAGRNDQ